MGNGGVRRARRLGSARSGAAADAHSALAAALAGGGNPLLLSAADWP
jgi:hypothetical protein